ncbi:hypothetical protein DY000_02035219 [Brassica cretica]|uniref:Anaphase-promoting complex subunit 4 WD40 domain-containing protein n=1 Tax=Brassica cretica TaxID=69181 RepID=A0ABQ7DJQ5_BRACR|nr:hypothetical protein DY000_02035219 [Brassica cretica]
MVCFLFLQSYEERSLEFEIDPCISSPTCTAFLWDLGIVTASADCSILATDVETGASVAHLEHAHEDAVNTLITVTETTIASGDDQGCVKWRWDTICKNHLKLLDTYLMFVIVSSYLIDFQNGRKVICGTQNGILVFMGIFQRFDRFVDLSPNSVDVLLELDEDRVITGCDNGIISLVGILPNRIIQPIGSHEFPIEDLAVYLLIFLSRMITSFLVAQLMTLWDLEEIIEGSNGNASGGAAGESDSDNEEMDLDNDPKPSRATFWNILKHFFLEISTKRKTKSKPTPVDTKTSFFADSALSSLYGQLAAPRLDESYAYIPQVEHS